MPRKPTSLSFGHRNIKIKYISHTTAQKRKIMAEVDPDTNTMYIDKSLDNPTTINCILHEMMHIIADHYSWEIPANHEELVCETGINGICDLLSQNNKLLEYLANSLKKD
jgi:hypothetical protein